MKVTFLCPLNGNLNPGGAEQQAFQTAHELRNLGVEVEYLTPLSTDLGDLVHAFGPYNEYDRVQSFARCETKQPIGVRRFFAQSYTFNCQPPVAARAAATAAGVKGRRNSSGSQRCKKLQRTAAS